MLETIGEKVTPEQETADLDVLRAYIEKTYPGLSPNRSIFSHVLELLRTERANYRYHAARGDLKSMLEDAKRYREWLAEMTEKSILLADKVLELDKLLEGK